MKWGKLHPGVIPLLEEAQIIEMTGWTPEEVDKQDASKIKALQVIWGAKGATPRRDNREMRKLG